MDSAMEQKLRELLDRQEIIDCMHRYCRGVDRLDRELLLSAYHPDAIDDHGQFVGTAAEFVEYAIPLHLERYVTTTHLIANIQLEIEGDVACGECYWILSGKNKTPPHRVSTGRYIDRFERRNGQWKIAARTCISESSMMATPAQARPQVAGAKDRGAIARRDRSDLSYVR